MKTKTDAELVLEKLMQNPEDVVLIAEYLFGQGGTPEQGGFLHEAGAHITRQEAEKLDSIRIKNHRVVASFTSKDSVRFEPAVKNV